MTLMRGVSAALATGLLLCAQAASAAEAGFRVIVHPGNSVTSLTPEDVSRIFLKKTDTWSNGQTIRPVDLPASSPARASFSKAVLHRTVANVKAYWQQQLFSGADVPPPEEGSDAEVVAFVRANPNAIGYVSSDAPIEGTKAVSVTGE